MFVAVLQMQLSEHVTKAARKKTRRSSRVRIGRGFVGRGVRGVGVRISTTMLVVKPSAFFDARLLLLSVHFQVREQHCLLAFHIKSIRHIVTIIVYIYIGVRKGGKRQAIKVKTYVL